MATSPGGAEVAPGSPAGPPPGPRQSVRRRRRRRWPIVLLVIVTIGLLAAGTAVVAIGRLLNPPGGPGPAVEVVIPQGSSTQRIAAILDDRGVVRSARVFRLYARFTDAGPFRAGTYELRRDAAVDDVIASLERGPQITYVRLTVPEGLTLDQIAQRVARLPGRSAERFLEVAKSGTVRSRFQPPGPANLEGLLFPDTYQFETKEDEAAILARMVARFDEVATELGLAQASARVGVNPYEAVTVASLVEREARVPEDRAPVAQVVYNRLRRGMLLQVDATVLYALGEHKQRVLFRDLEVDSPYNTYKVKGLPPTPIAAPGRAALEAALNPSAGPYLFYVVVEPSGRHAFAATAAEHQRNIRLAERNGVR